MAHMAKFKKSAKRLLTLRNIAKNNIKVVVEHYKNITFCQTDIHLNQIV